MLETAKTRWILAQHFSHAVDAMQGALTEGAMPQTAGENPINGHTYTAPGMIGWGRRVPHPARMMSTTPF